MSTPLAISAWDVNQLLYTCPKVELHGRGPGERVRILGRWEGPMPGTRALRFQCVYCNFEGGVSITDRRVTTQFDFDASEFGGVFFIANSDFENTLIIRHGVFDREVRVENARFYRGMDLQDSVFEGPLFVAGSVFGSVVDFSNADFWGPVKFHDTECFGSVHWESASFHEDAKLEDSTFSGVVILRNSEFNAPWVMERAFLLQGADFRFAVFGPCSEEHLGHCRKERKQCEGSLELKDSSLAGPLWLQSTEHVPHGHRVLLLSGSVFETVRGKTWTEMRNMMQPLFLAETNTEIRNQRLQEHLVTLRQLERSFLAQGFSEDATQVELDRRKLEAQGAGLVEIAFYWFMFLTCQFGYSLWRLPLWCFAWTLVFASALRMACAGTGFSSRAFIPKAHDIWESLHLFLNLSEPKGAYQGERGNRKRLERIARIEQIFGFWSMVITTLILGAYIAR